MLERSARSDHTNYFISQMAEEKKEAKRPAPIKIPHSAPALTRSNAMATSDFEKKLAALWAAHQEDQAMEDGEEAEDDDKTEVCLCVRNGAAGAAYWGN